MMGLLCPADAEGITQEDVEEFKREELDLDFECLLEDGYVWRDGSGKEYTEEDLTDSHLKNILKFCERNYRPSEQIKMLEEIAKMRGLE